jgi:transcriptional regulator of acetoin/glycerol metabolism
MRNEDVSVRSEEDLEPTEQRVISVEIILPWSEVEKRTIARALRICAGSVPKAAAALELGEATLYRKIKKYGLPR